MPRYFFQVIDGRDIIDRVGTMLPGLKRSPWPGNPDGRCHPAR